MKFRRTIKTILIIVLISQFGVIYSQSSKSNCDFTLGKEQNIEIPKVDYYEINPYNEFTHRLFIFQKGKLRKKIIICADDQKIELEEISSKMNEWKGKMTELNLPKITIQLIVQSNIEIGIINKVKRKLIDSHIPRIAYSVLPNDKEGALLENGEFCIISTLPQPEFERYYIPQIKETKDAIHLRQTKGTDNILYNGQEVYIKDLKERLKKDIKQNPSLYIKYHYYNELNYSNYISVLSITHLAVSELRDEYSMNKYSKKYAELSKSAAREIIWKYGYNLLEINEEIEKMLTE